MYENNIFTDGNELAREQTEMGFIGGMMDGFIESFEFRGLTVEAEREFMAVKDDETGETIGMKIHMKNWSLEEAHDWLENKAAMYGEATYVDG